MTYRVRTQDPDEGEIVEHFATAKECAEALGENVHDLEALKTGWTRTRKFKTFLGEATVDYCN